MDMVEGLAFEDERRDQAVEVADVLLGKADALPCL